MQKGNHKIVNVAGWAIFILGILWEIKILIYDLFFESDLLDSTPALMTINVGVFFLGLTGKRVKTIED